MASQAATPMATIMLCPGRPTQRLPRPIGPNKIPRNEDTRPANGRYARGRADIPPSRSCCPAKQGSPTRSNLHSLDSWSAVSCNEGFCNAAEPQSLPSTTCMASQKPHHSRTAATLNESLPVNMVQPLAGQFDESDGMPRLKDNRHRSVNCRLNLMIAERQA